MTIDAIGDGKRGDRGGGRGRLGGLAALWPSALGDQESGRDAGSSGDKVRAARWRTRRRAGVVVAMLASALLAPGYIAGQGEGSGGRLALFRAAPAAGSGEEGSDHGGGAGGGAGRSDAPSSPQPTGPGADHPNADVPTEGPGAGATDAGPGAAGGGDPPGVTFLEGGPHRFGPGFGPVGLFGGGGGGGGGGGAGGGGGGFTPPDPGVTDPPGTGGGPTDPPIRDTPIFEHKPTVEDPTYVPDLPGPVIGDHDDPGGGGPHGGVVPEPATWGLMILGFGAVGCLLRRRRIVLA